MPYIKSEPGSEVVISGISGKYPQCTSIKDLTEKLMNQEDLISDVERWSIDSEEIPKRMGTVPNVNKFDALYFGIHAKQALTMDPMSRILLEQACEAVMDAGINPAELRGRKIAVVIGLSFCESERFWFYQRSNTGGFGITGSSRAMIANRISYFLGVHGPSYVIDTACSSSSFALEQCYRFIKSGECEAAIVGGVNLCLHPFITLHYSRMGVLSPDGRCKTFDANANGYVRSDAMTVTFLQKEKDAKRIYATVVHCKTNQDGHKESITQPSSKVQEELLRNFYNECPVAQDALEYLEAHGIGTKSSDLSEISAIDAAICKKRSKPLKIGSVKTNMGHSEPASGLCSVSKVVIAMENRIIPPNINFKQPRKSLRAIVEGRLQVVTEPTPWKGGYAAINTFGFGGSNAHILLKSHDKEKRNKGLPSDNLPRLVAASGRTEEAVASLLNSVEEAKLDVEYVRLLHDIFATDIPNHGYRGYTLVGMERVEKKIQEIAPFNESNRPVWFVFSGMGSQWFGMGKALMKFPVFANAIRKCDAILKPRGLDIVHIISTDDKTIFDSILHSFVGIAAVQIGLVDLLTTVGIKPDKIIGHSVGELGCAYADGCFTAEQMILAAYARGMASIETELIFGSMAAVGLGFKEMQNMCPDDIDVACHNSNTSCTISGPAESVKAFVAELNAQKIFAREVNTSNIAYHSRYIAEAGPKLLKNLREIIPEPKERSEKWLSTSVPEKDWSTEAAKYSSAEYHTNNLLSSVLFEETSRFIPPNAITIEIAPHGLLQAILKRSLAPETSNVPLTLRGHKDNAEFFLQALGKLYNLGLQPQLANFYPPIQFPVSRGTPMISPYVKWDHSTDWFVALFNDKEKIASGERVLEIHSTDQRHMFMKGYVIGGRNIFSATGYLGLVWETFALMKGKLQATLSVIFEDVQFKRPSSFPKYTPLKLIVIIQKGSGRFEILDGDIAVVTGAIYQMSNPIQHTIPANMKKGITDEEELNMEDIYTELAMRGYDYQGVFRGLSSATLNANKGHIIWNDNWVAYLDAMIQLKILASSDRKTSVPSGIRKLTIDVKRHQDLLEAIEGDQQKKLPVYMYKNLDVIVSGGIQMSEVLVETISQKIPSGIPVLEEYKFVAHRDKANLSLHEMITLSTHIALESEYSIQPTIIEVIEKQDNVPLESIASPVLLHVLKQCPMVEPNVKLAISIDTYKNFSLPKEIEVIEPTEISTQDSTYIAVGHNLLTKEKDKTVKEILLSLRSGGFILTQENVVNGKTISRAKDLGLNIITEKSCANKTLLLLKKVSKVPKETEVITVTNEKLDWIGRAKEILKTSFTKDLTDLQLILVAQEDKYFGILGLAKCLRKEPGGQIVRTVIIQDAKAPKFDIKNPFYAQQLQLNLPFNVLQNGIWGSYMHLPLASETPTLVQHAYIDQMVRGNLSSFCWLEGPMSETDNYKNLIHIVYGSMNFKDLKEATDTVDFEPVHLQRKALSPFGFEYSGVTSSGHRVMGILSQTGLSNLCVPEENVVWDVPDEWSLEDAATVPIAYATAYLALYHWGDMTKGEKVLIHSGCSSVGQAAINLALAAGCEVFTTVENSDKRKFIKETFPAIDDNHIGNSNDSSFEQLILEATNGQGIDIVLNNLLGEKLLASVRCLATRGRFLELGKHNVAANNPLYMLAFLREISFKFIMLDYATYEDRVELQNMRVTIKNLIKQGAIKPIVRTVFGRNQIEDALRYMSTDKHIGKVLLKLADESGPLNKPVVAYRQFHALKNRSYIIFEGLNGLGLEVAQWLSIRGAKHLVLVSQNGVTTGYQKLKIKDFKSRGTKVIILTGKDGSNHQDCEFILKTAEKEAPVDGIINLPVKSTDALFIDQTAKDFEESLKSKVGLTKMLDEESRKICSKLRYFVVFSSISSGRGTAKQTIDGYANSLIESICQRRVAQGLPGLAIQWGASTDIALITNTEMDNKEIGINGILQQQVSSLLQDMERLLLQNQPVVASMLVAEIKNHLAAETPLQVVMSTLGLNNETTDKEICFAQLGFDFVQISEVKSILERKFDIFSTIHEIENLNILRLNDLSAAIMPTTEENVNDAEIEIHNFFERKQILKLIDSTVLRTDVAVELNKSTSCKDTMVIFIPGIEGSFDIFSAMLKQLRYSTIALQIPYSQERNTIDDTVEFLLSHVVGKLKGITHIVVVGYSLASVITVEFVRKLEIYGYDTNIVLIDGTPDIIKTSCMEKVKGGKQEDVENSIVLSAVKAMNPSELQKTAEELKECTTFDEKLNVVTTVLSASIASENQKIAIKNLNHRVYAATMYDNCWLPPLEAGITFIKANKSLYRHISMDHGLERLTNGDIKVLEAEGDHYTILENERVPVMINNIVDEWISAKPMV